MVRVGALEIALDRNFHLGGAANAELLGCSWGHDSSSAPVRGRLQQVWDKYLIRPSVPLDGYVRDG